MSDTEKFNINFENVIASKNVMSVTKMLAIRMRDNPYLTPGDFIGNMADGDLFTLLHISEDEADEHFAELLLIAEMLAQAEGLPAGDEDTMVNRISMLIGFITCESLARKGMVRVHYENMSFGEEMSQKIIVEKIQ